MTEQFFEYENDQYGRGIIIEEYNEELSLCAGVRGKDGKVYKRWGFPEKQKKPMDKAIPWKLRLGSPREAVEMLTAILEALRTFPGAPTDDGDSIPF